MGNTFPDNKITVTMISNAMNHHQFPFCDSMSRIDDILFHFIATKPIAQERLKTGFRDLNSSRSYIIKPYESDHEYTKAKKLADESDFVIYGSAPYTYIKNRKKVRKWTFLYSERLFKEVRGGDIFKIKTITACMLRYFFSSHKHLRLLCSSAFTSNDYRHFRFPAEQTYKWGYFPPESQCSAETLLENKAPATIVWVGRMIDWKHPETAIELAQKLHIKNQRFQMRLIGDGPMIETLKKTVKEEQLENDVSFLGSLPAEQVRAEMEKAQIMIATSDHNEGWGAVINEGMASGCAVVASHLMGSVPYLIEDGKNGRVFESGNIDDLFEKVRQLLVNPKECETLGRNAYDTISHMWNGKNAAERLAELMRRYHNGETDFAYQDGICSHAECLKNNWFMSK